ncbi:MAG: ATP synthase F1 subunit delta [Saprospiraceae bacterium]|nr:ATP synthase F1 subunit delta [Saprospiraceae bacterium]
MSVSKIAGRYAKSLLDLAQERSQIEQVSDDINTVSTACQNKDLILFLKNPVIHSDKKVNVFRSVFEGKLSNLTQTFLELLIQKGRESIIPAISQSFIEQYKVLKNIRSARLISATQLSDTEVNQIKSKFQSWLKPNETMELSQHIDPSIIGGYIFQMGGRQVDATAKRSLESMKSGLYDSSYTNLVIKS